MTAAVTIAKRALNAIGAHSEVNPADPELLSIGLNELVGLLEGLVEDETYVGGRLTGLTSAGMVATAEKAAHGFEIGREVIIAGAAQAGYNGRFIVVAMPTADTFTYALDAALDSPATASDDARGITALQLPDALADYLEEARGATTALQFLLAVKMGPICRVPVPLDVKEQAALGAQMLKNRYRSPSIPSLVPSRLLPRGQGSTRGRLPAAHFQGESLDDDSPS